MSMADAGFVRFPPTLNPTAQEFRPTFPYTTTAVLPAFMPHPIYYSYPPPPPMESYIIPGQHPPPSPVPTRALLLSSVPADVSESTVRRELEVFGDVRAVHMERLLRDGIVTVHFYDLRQAIAALNEIQGQHMQQQCRLRKHFERRLMMFLSPNNINININIPPPPLPPPARGLLSGRAIWAQFTFPVAASLPDGYNQGTVVVLDSDHVSASVLRDIFEAFGGVKEIREALVKKKQKVVVEFYDTRDAVKAIAGVNGHENIDGKRLVVEFSRPYNYNKLINNKSNVVPPPPLPSYRKDKVVDYGGRDEGNYYIVVNSKKNNGRWVDGGGNCGRNKPQAWWNKGGSRYTSRGEKCDSRFLIKEDAAPAIISSFLDSRTTVMIKNIPNKYSQKLLLNMLDNHCIHCNEQQQLEAEDQPLSAYDFVYLPIDFVNKCNVGYGFVNMTSPEATWRLYKSFHHQNWEIFNSKKICQVSYARLQGLEALKEHFKNSKFPREAEDQYMPVVFTPPRDGRTLTEPMAIVRRSSNVTSSSSSSSSEVDRGACLDVTCSLADSSSSSSLTVEDMKKSEDTITGKGGEGDGDV